MKKLYTLLTIVVFICSVSCSKENYCTPSEVESTENTEPQIDVPLVKYTILVGQEESKVTISAAGEANWEEGDKLYVFNSAWSSLLTNGAEATLTGGAGESSAVFEFEAPVERNEGFYVLYGAEGSLEEGKLQVTVPNTVEGSAKPILACYTQDLSGSIALKCITTYVRITLPESMASVDIFPVHNSEEKLCGTVAIGADNGYSYTRGTHPKVTVNNPSSVFYVNLLPGTLSKGYIVCFSGASGKMFKSVSYGTSIALEPKSMINLAPATYTPISATVTPVTNHSKYKAGDVSGANNLSYRLKTHSCSVSPVANVNDNLKKHFTVEKYYYDTTSESAIGEFTFSDVGSYTIQASFKFECEGVSYEQLKIAQGTADITGLPYNVPMTTDGWSGSVSTSSGALKISCNGNPTVSKTCSNMFYNPGNLISKINCVYQTTANERSLSGGTCTINVNSTKITSYTISGGFAHNKSISHNGTTAFPFNSSPEFSLAISGAKSATTAFVLINKISFEY